MFPVVSPELAPRFGNVGWKGALTPNVFILVCMLSTAFMAHFNSPKFYTELKNNTLERFQQGRVHLVWNFHCHFLTHYHVGISHLWCRQ